MNGKQPVVTCIMPTANRPQFIGQAISYFQRQDYEAKELIIVDDGDVPVADLVPDAPDIRYIRLENRLSLGEKRNMACRLGQGELIAHWDDDDWTAPDRLSTQVRQLSQTGAAVCGSSRLLHYDLKAGEAWLYTYLSDRLPWLAGCTMLYKREVWCGNLFEAKNNGEDTAFVRRVPPEQVCAIPGVDLCVSIIHGRNTAMRSLNNPRWERRPIAEVRDKLGNDAGFYAALRSGLGHSTTAEIRRQPDQWLAQPAKYRVGRGSHAHKDGEKRPFYSESSRVTVSIPYYRCKPYLSKAVESILAQTYSNLVLVVVNDNDEDEPWEVLAHIDDPRLIRFDLEENRGRYFADAVVLNATADRYFLVQDADDYSEPERLWTLLQKLREEHADGVVSSLYEVSARDGQVNSRRPVRYPPSRRQLGADLAHRLSHFGLFKAAVLKQLGGFYGGYRISYDTLLMNLLLMASRIAYVEEPLYTRVIRPNSLTTSQATGLRSTERSRVRRYHKEIYRRSYAAYNLYVAGELSAEELTSLIRKESQRHVTAAEQLALKQESDRLRAVIGRHLAEMGQFPAQ